MGGIMTNVIIGGTASEATPLPEGISIDGTTDLIPIWHAADNSTVSITRNILLGVTGQPADISSSQTFTNKTLTSPGISGPVFSGTITGTYTIGGTPTFPSSVVTLTGTQTLTNKTLTSPTVNTPTITNATISANAISGYTTSNTGVIYGISVTTGAISSALSLTSTLAVTGAATLSSTLAVSGATTISSTLSTTGLPTFLSATAIPAAGSNTVGIKFSSTSNFGIYWGSGAPTFSAAQGSIYLRSDGSSSSTRMYVNSTGSTTWVNFTSAS